MTPSPHRADQPGGDVAHPTRTTRFGSLEIAYDDRVLQPREWTTHQSRWAAELLVGAPAGPVLELCAGAGQIGLLAVAGLSRRLVCVDVNPVACDYARRNAAAAGLAGRVEVREGDLQAVISAEERFPVILADPPYLRPDELASYPEDPRLAVDGGPDGLSVARTCLAVIHGHLLPGGSALLQLRDLEQVDQLDSELATSDLTVAGSRGYERGALVLLHRP
ncbi:MAG TPA: class I SAM-dependent methyltransferase [Nocardioides sp.]|nr:class I SAM-dependent methyltransferase [Nocardioides sp.]